MRAAGVSPEKGGFHTHSARRSVGPLLFVPREGNLPLLFCVYHICSLFRNDFLELLPVLIMHHGVFIHQYAPAPQRAPDDYCHHAHDQQTQDDQQIMAAWYILIKNQPDASIYINICHNHVALSGFCVAG